MKNLIQIDDNFLKSLELLIYQGIASPDGFQGFIELLCKSADLKAVTLIIVNATTQEAKGLWLTGIEPRWIESYALHYASEDMLGVHIRGAPESKFYASNLHISQDFIKTNFYRKWIAPQGVAYAAGAILSSEQGWLTQIFIQRSYEQPAYSEVFLDELNKLLPHLKRALELHQLFTDLKFNHSFLTGGLDVLRMPTILFDDYGRVVHKNKAAIEFLNATECFKVADGHFQVKTIEIQRKIQLDLHDMIRLSREEYHPKPKILSLERLDQPPLILMIAPMRTGVAKQGAALMFIYDSEKTNALTSDLVGRIFGLSKAESDLAVALCKGETLEHVAQDRGVTLHTVKTQLKNIFLKTGTNRQADLVSILLTSPAYLLFQED